MMRRTLFVSPHLNHTKFLCSSSSSSTSSASFAHSFLFRSSFSTTPTTPTPASSSSSKSDYLPPPPASSSSPLSQFLPSFSSFSLPSFSSSSSSKKPAGPHPPLNHSFILSLVFGTLTVFTGLNIYNSIDPVENEKNYQIMLAVIEEKEKELVEKKKIKEDEMNKKNSNNNSNNNRSASSASSSSSSTATKPSSSSSSSSFSSLFSRINAYLFPSSVQCEQHNLHNTEFPKSASNNNNNHNNNNNNNNGNDTNDADPNNLYITPSCQSEYRIFSGSGNPALAQEVAARLGTQVGRVTVGKFADGEINIQVHDNVRDQTTYIIQPVSYPANDNLMELLLLISTLRRASANRIVAVLPYFGYARQYDMPSILQTHAGPDGQPAKQSSSTIAGADVALMLESMGVDQVVCVDLHRGQVQGFFDASTPVENLDTSTIAVPYFLSKSLHDPVIMSPCGDGVRRAIKFRDLMMSHGVDSSMALMYIKDKTGYVDSDSLHHQVLPEEDVMELVGDVKGRDVIIVDVKTK